MSFVLPGLLGETSVLDLSFRWSPTYSVALIGAGALALSLLSSTLGWHKRAPGPRPLPIFGNIFDFDIAQPWHTFTKWKTAYGDVIGLRAPGTNILVLNSLQAITDLLDKRGPMYSHRPVFTVVGELMGLDNSLPLMEYGPEYRNARKLMHLALNPAAIKRYEIMQEDFAALLARDLLDTPRDFFDHIRLTAGRIILSVSYGLDVQTADSKYIAHAEDTMKLISESTVPGAYLADFIPTMKYLPSWLSFQKRAVEGKEMIERLVTAPYEHVKRDMVQAEGIARPSLTHQLLLDNEGSLTPETDHLLKWTVGALYGAGGETTYATTLVNIMAMALNPEKQRLAQAEIDRVLGGERLPVIADRSRLPYVDAVVKETMRWHPSLPLGIARRVAEDDVYEGYNIPKGTVVMPNAWAIALADDAKYPPEQFIPERFLDTEHKTVDPAVYSFGWGRRVCPGKALGEGNVFILISTILAVFTLLPPEDEPLKVEFTPNLVSYPKPFRCRIIPRSQEIAETVRRRATQGTV